MLEAALRMRDAFDRLEQIDIHYKFNPSKDEWEVARVICDCLRKFFEVTKHFSGTSFPTSNVFFPDVCNIRLSLMEWENSRHDFLHNMTVSMKAKFVKYWEECSLLLAIAVVLDLRFKLDLVEYYYFRIYGSETDKYVPRVRSCLFNLFTKYGGESSQSQSRLDCGNPRNVVDKHPTNDTLSGLDSWYATVRASNILIYQKSELDLYLDEHVFPSNDDFNILQWWKVNSVKLHTLARMARDVLVAEAAFSVGGRVLDEYRASYFQILLRLLELLNDWIESE